MFTGSLLVVEEVVAQSCHTKSCPPARCRPLMLYCRWQKKKRRKDKKNKRAESRVRKMSVHAPCHRNVSTKRGHLVFWNTEYRASLGKSLALALHQSSTPLVQCVPQFCQRLPWTIPAHHGVTKSSLSTWSTLCLVKFYSCRFGGLGSATRTCHSIIIRVRVEMSFARNPNKRLGS